MKISDERLAFAIEQLRCVPNSSSAIWLAELEELQRSRALVTDLRALAERMRNFQSDRWDRNPANAQLHQGRMDATESLLAELDSLLAAHEVPK